MQRIGQIIAFVLFFSLLIVLANRIMRSERDHEAAGRSKKRDDYSDTRSSGSIPPGVRPKPVLSVQ